MATSSVHWRTVSRDAHLARPASHLGANEVNLSENPVKLGPVLTFDSERREFTGESAQYANMFLKRVYRPPFVLPEDV